VLELKQVLLAISRVRPDDDVTTENNKASDTDCRNNCFNPLKHCYLDNKPSFLVGGGAIGPPNIPDDLGI